ncbi:MAG: hypothetical protein FWB86_11665 [Treponema sp.]|nr:hypothetical protein [Treponema sp.]MCL2252542.1 hypothetical protein [Treponema sp.]
MKNLIFVLFFLAIFSPIFAQSTEGHPAVYYQNVTIERIIPTSRGYVIQYRAQEGIKIIGIPNEWFTERGNRADLVKLPTASDWPSMSVFYNDGKFTHVRIYVSRFKSHVTWGNLPQGTDLNRFFSDEDTLNFQY